KLLKDLKELAEYDQSTSTNRPIFLNDNEDHPVQNRDSPENSSEENIVTKTNQEPPQDSDIHQLIDECCEDVPEEQKQNMKKTMFDLVKICHHKQFLCIHDDIDDLIESALDSKLLSINYINSQRLDKKEEPENSLSMRYKHLSITPETESDEVTESNVENLLPIPSECEILFDSNNDDLSSDDESFEDIEYVDASVSNPAIVSVEEENVDHQEEEEELLIDDSTLSHESFDSNFEDNPSISRPPPEPPDDNFDLEPEDYPPEIEVILCWIYVRFPRSSYPLIDFSLGRSISF
nr:hypothetical protein [Tanacetum cinerariifolium]